MIRKKIYTAITGGYEAPREDIKVFTGENQFVQPVMDAKIYKVLSHLYVDADISVWVDGNIFPKLSVHELIDKYLPSGVDMAVFQHPYRNHLFEEFQALKYVERLRRSPKFMANILKQEQHYKATGNMFAPMFECGFIIRRHNIDVEEFNNAWWAEICRWTERDQLSFSYLLGKFPDIKLAAIPGNIRNHPDFTYTNLH